MTEELGAGADDEKAGEKQNAGVFSPSAPLPRRALRGISMLCNWHQLTASYPSLVCRLWPGGGRPCAGGSVPTA